MSTPLVLKNPVNSRYISNMDLESIVKKLRLEKTDTLWIEAKRAEGGLPSSIDTTICAMANLPGGGVIILGLDEGTNFQPVALTDIPALKQGLIGKARACVPRVVLEIWDQEQSMVEGSEVVVAVVKEADNAQKPVRVSDGGKGYKRDWDGDYPLSIQEEQGFQSLRTHPASDRKSVQGATREDLDPDLVKIYEEAVRTFDPGGLGRFVGEEVLLRAEVIKDSQGTPSVAGILALGKYPQQFFPRFVVVLSKRSSSDPSASRGTNVKTLTGPIPLILEEALEWAKENFSTSIIGDASDGSVSDKYDYPLEAFRELIGNALVHRDLADWSQGDAIEVRLLPDCLIITSPGGLFGITVEELGTPGTTSARNARLVEILKYTRTLNGKRVVETLSSGMPLILEAAKLAGLPTPIFQDRAISFKVIWKSAPQSPTSSSPITQAPSATDVSTLNLSPKSMLIVAALQVGPKTASQLVAELGIKKDNVQYHLSKLVKQGIILSSGGVGKTNSYRLPN